MRPGIQAALALLAFTALTPVSAGAQDPRGGAVRNSYIVTFAPDAGPPERVARDLVRGQGAGLRHVYSHALRGMAIEVPEHAAPRVLEALRRNPRVASIGNDMLGAGVAQSLPKGIDRINAEPGQRPNDASGIRVAIIDSGLDFAHADLQGGIDLAASVTCVNVSGCVPGGADDNGHGTFVGGIVGARDNDLDVVGVAPASTLLSVKVLAADNTGMASDFIAGVDHLVGLNAAGKRIDVANASIVFTCSFCTATSTNSTVNAMRKAISALVAGGTTFVAAAGNDAADAATTLPAAFADTVAVSALSDADGLPGNESMASFSNFGSAIDIAAPGVGERSLRRGGGTSTGNGTSFAAPHVAGAAALFIRDHQLKTGQKPDPATVRRALVETGECRGGLQHGGLGCDRTWSGDRDSFAEPLVRADLVAGFTGAVADVALSALDVAAPVVIGETQAVRVGVTNAGTQAETVAVSLAESGVEIGLAGSVALAAGESRTLDFAWAPRVTGSRVLTARVDPVPGESDLGDNSLAVSVDVLDATVRDVALAALSAPSGLVVGETATVDVDVANRGTVDESVAVALTGTALAGGSSGSFGDPQTLTLAAGSGARLSFAWSTSGAAEGDHELAATVTLVGATDADPGDNVGKATVRLVAAAEAPAPTENPAPSATALYVKGIALDIVSRGRKTELRGTASLRLDSDDSGSATAADANAKGAGVVFEIARDSDGDGVFDCARDVCQTVATSSNGKGEAGFALAEPASGSYRVTIVAAELAGALHDPSLDSGNPASIVLR